MGENKHQITVTNQLSGDKKIFGKKQDSTVVKEVVRPNSMTFKNLIHKKKLNIWVNAPEKKEYFIIVNASKTCEFTLKKQLDVENNKMIFYLQILNEVRGHQGPGPGGDPEGEKVTVTINDGKGDIEP